MPARRGLLAPQNTFLDTIATRFDGTHSNFVLGNAQVPNIYPIVYCSDGFCELTGYPRAQIMQKGCACNFLFGPETSDEHKKEIEQSLESKSELKLEVTFYKSGGIPFTCLLDIVPIKNEKHEVVLFLASHKELNKHKNNNSGNSDDEKTDDADDDNSEEEDEDENFDHDGDDNSKANHYNRRRSRAVLYQLSGHYRRSVTVKGKIKLNNNILHSSALPEYKAASLKKPRFILSHYGAFKTCFDWLILIATFYVAIVVPFGASFRDNMDIEHIKTIYTDVFVEVIFIIDIILSFRTTYVNKKGEVVADTKSVVMHYLKGWFICDLLAALPFDVLYVADLYSRNTLIHLLKLTRLLRLVRLFAKMDRYSQYSYIILTLLMLMFSLVAHWLACIWYVIAVEEIEVNPTDWDVSWLRQLSFKLGYDVLNKTDVASAYITALYFTTSSLTSVGFGNVSANTNAEKIFSVFIMLIGALMHAVVFGNVTAIIQRMYARRSQYHTKLRDLKDFFRLHQIPKRLRTRMTEYFQTTWSLNHGIDPNEVLREFPDELRGDVSLHLHREILSLPIFDTAPQGFLKLMARYIKSNFCAPGEYLVHTGDALNYLYLVCNGSMEVLQNDMVVAILGKGDLVGCDIPFSLVSETLVKSSSEVKALTYCDLKSIHINGLLEVLRMYPEFAETFCTEIIHDLTFNLREGYQADPIMMNSHSLTLPSISEDDEDDDGSCRDDHDEDSGSGSPPSSPSTGAGAVAVMPIRRKTVTMDGHEPNGYPRRPRVINSGTPLIHHGPTSRKPALKFCNKNPSQNSKSSSERTRSKESYDGNNMDLVTVNTRIDKLDSQMNTLNVEMSKLTSELKMVVGLVSQLCNSNNVASISANPPPIVTESEVTFEPSRIPGATITEPSSPKCPSLTSTSSCSQLLAPTTGRFSSTKSCQTERSLLEDLLTKMTDSGSPPPNSGYSSSSSNEEKVKYLIGIHQSRSGNHSSSHHEPDTESISDDSVLRPSNSLNIQSMTSSRDVSPFKGSRNSWNTSGETMSSSVTSPLPSPRPLLNPNTSSGHSKSSLLMSHPSQMTSVHNSGLDRIVVVGSNAATQPECTIDIEEGSRTSTSSSSTFATRDSSRTTSAMNRSSTTTSSSGMNTHE